MVEHFSSSCEGIMPQDAKFGDVFIDINVDGMSVGFVGFVVLCVNHPCLMAEACESKP